MSWVRAGIGAAEGPGTKNFSDALRKAGVHNVYFESPGTAHEWLTWRRDLNVPCEDNMQSTPHPAPILLQRGEYSLSQPSNPAPTFQGACLQRLL